MTPRPIGARIAEALGAACHPRPVLAPSVPVMDPGALVFMVEAVSPPGAINAPAGDAVMLDMALVVTLFEREGRSLVRLAGLFVDDRNAAEDIVQEAFIRLARSAQRIKDPAKAAAYLRSIVLNLARDHNRRGLVSLRHHCSAGAQRPAEDDDIELRDDHREVIDALRALPHRQRDCVVLRYYQELGIDEIAEALSISRNSVKTHLKRGLAATEARLAASASASAGGGR